MCYNSYWVNLVDNFVYPATPHTPVKTIVKSVYIQAKTLAHAQKIASSAYKKNVHTFIQQCLILDHLIDGNPKGKKK